MNLNEQVDKIKSRKDFIVFINNLCDDLKNRPEDWENLDLQSFLGAVAAWVVDMDGFYENNNKPIPQQPSWRLAGEIFLAAKHYE